MYIHNMRHAGHVGARATFDIAYEWSMPLSSHTLTFDVALFRHCSFRLSHTLQNGCSVLKSLQRLGIACYSAQRDALTQPFLHVQCHTFAHCQTSHARDSQPHTALVSHKRPMQHAPLLPHLQRTAIDKQAASPRSPKLANTLSTACTAARTGRALCLPKAQPVDGLDAFHRCCALSRT